MAIVYDWTNTQYQDTNKQGAEQNKVQSIIGRVGKLLRRNPTKYLLLPGANFAGIVNGIRTKNANLDIRKTYHDTGMYLGHRLLIPGAVGWITVRTSQITYHVYELQGGKQFKITFFGVGGRHTMTVS